MKDQLAKGGRIMERVNLWYKHHAYHPPVNGTISQKTVRSGNLTA